MAVAAEINITGTLTTLPDGGSRHIGPIVISSADANSSELMVVLASGDNTITVPQLPLPTGCIIDLPPTNTQATKLKGAGGDTGNTIGKTGPTLWTWDPTAPPANFILNSAAAQTGLVTKITFF